MTPEERTKIKLMKLLRLKKAMLIASLNDINLQKGMIDTLVGDIKEHPALLEFR